MSTKTMLEQIDGKPALYLGSLPDGTYFEFVGLEKLYRGLRVERVTSGGAMISGQKNTDGGWKPLPSPYQVSASSHVRIVSGGDLEETETMENTNTEDVADAVEPQQETGQKATEPAEEKVKKPREALDFQLPDGEFTVKMVCELNGAQPPKVHLFLKEQVDAGKVVNLGSRPTGQKGKPPIWFKKA